MRPNIAETVDATFWLVFGISVFLLLVVVVAMFYFIYKFNKKRHPVAEQISGHTGLEITWTVIPLILVIIMFFSGYYGFENMRNVPAGADSITVTGQMWKWSYTYPNGKKSDTLYVPLGKDIHMLIQSIDVNHSFYIPSMRVKEDAVPGRTNYLWFNADKLGSYEIACAEYCGLDHWNMYSRLVIIPQEKYYEWLYAKPDSNVSTTTTTTTTPTDTVKTSAGANDTTKSKTDSLKTNKNDSAIKKDSVK